MCLSSSLLGELFSKPMRGLVHVLLTNEKSVTCHPGVLSSMLRWWHSALCLFPFLTSSPYFDELPPAANHRPVLWSPDQWESVAWWWEDRETWQWQEEPKWEDLNRRRENRQPWHELLGIQAQDTILSILKQTMRHKTGETIAQFSLDKAGFAAWLPSQTAFNISNSYDILIFIPLNSVLALF